MKQPTKLIISNLYISMMEFSKQITEIICELDIVLEKPIKTNHCGKLISINKMQKGIFYSGERIFYHWLNFDWNTQIDIIMKLAISYKVY